MKGTLSSVFIASVGRNVMHELTLSKNSERAFTIDGYTSTAIGRRKKAAK